MARNYVYRFCYDYNSVSRYFQSRIGLHLQHSDCNILLKPFAESIKVILFWRESQIEGMLKLNLISWTLYSTALSDKSLLHFCYEWMSLLLTFKFVKIKWTKKEIKRKEQRHYKCVTEEIKKIGLKISHPHSCSITLNYLNFFN